MATDQNKKTLRSFQCRDYLWEIFEQMSQELECSVDYLINESMRQYARSRNFGRTSQPGLSAPRASQPPPARGPSIEARISPSSAPPSSPPAHRPDSTPPASTRASRPASESPEPQTMRPPVASVPSSPRASLPPGALDSEPPPPMSAPMPVSAPPPLAPPPLAPPPLRASSPGAPPPPLSPRASVPALPPAPPPLRSSSAALPPLPPKPPVSAPPQQVAGRPHLFVIFNGQKFPVAKDEFIIGRGSKSADLAIKDGNISRRHAAVVFHGGAYYMKDLGSTNGVDFGGQKVGTKRIDEGDLFQICDYELRFTYQ
jgi:neural Wiskott-Aldrich syndrome protein